MPDQKECPVCGELLDNPMRVDVCGDCFQDLRHSGAIPLQATGEFNAVSPRRAEAMLASEAQVRGRPKSFTADHTITCSWCGKRRDQVKKILSGEHAHICNECVALCAMILEDEVPDWR